MIVKIWAIKGTQGLKNCKLYIEDDKKIIKIDQDEEGHVTRRTVLDTQKDFHIDPDTYFMENEENIGRVVDYMFNEKKTQNKYVSGYLCQPDTAIENFKDTWDLYARKQNPKVISGMKDQTMSFHMVQSFPEDLDISDEEVHQCGLELLQKLENHQGLVCSHVHPVVDEEGEVHGKCKHNHILFNAYMLPEKVDPEHPQVVKYNDCRDTYAQLRIWNDQIAIDHGLPIIRNPDIDKVYSWAENAQIKQGQSWKERMRLDIEAARRVTNNWAEFKSYMEEFGYSIQDSGKYVTYTAPDKQHKARGNTLGRTFTKENLQLYWNIRNRTERAMEEAQKNNQAPPLWELSARESGPLKVIIPLGERKDKDKDGAFYPLPLAASKRNREVLNSYFNDNDLYDIQDANGRIIAAATGKEVIDYMVSLNRGEQMSWQVRKQREEEKDNKRRQMEEDTAKKKQEEEENRRDRYSSTFKNSRTGGYYYIDFRDEDGRCRSTLELMLLLAILVITNESDLWTRSPVPEGQINEAVFGPTDWKIQNMMDALHVAEQEGLQTPSDLDERLHEAGAAYSRARSALQRTKKSQERMAALDAAIREYEGTKEIAERLQAMSDGPEKTRLQEENQEIIDRYKKAKAVMYGYKVLESDEIIDFKQRYADIQKNLPQMQEELDKTKEDYRKLKKLQYNVSLAQNAQYCYGPDYDETKTVPHEIQGRQVSEKEFKERMGEREDRDKDHDSLE